MQKRSNSAVQNFKKQYIRILIAILGRRAVKFFFELMFPRGVSREKSDQQKNNFNSAALHKAEQATESMILLSIVFQDPWYSRTI